MGPGVGTISYAALVSQEGQLRVRSAMMLASVGGIRSATYPPKVKTRLRPQVAGNHCLGDRATMLDIGHPPRCHPPTQHFLEEREDLP